MLANTTSANIFLLVSSSCYIFRLFMFFHMKQQSEVIVVFIHGSCTIIWGCPRRAGFSQSRTVLFLKIDEMAWKLQNSFTLHKCNSNENFCFWTFPDLKKQDAWMDKIFLVLFLVAYHDQLIYPYLIILDVIYPSLVIYSAFLLTGSSLANSTLNSNQE